MVHKDYLFFLMEMNSSAFACVQNTKPLVGIVIEYSKVMIVAVKTPVHFGPLSVFPTIIMSLD